MSELPSTNGPDIDRWTMRLPEELRAWFVELICPVCHVVSGKVAVGNFPGQRAFDELHRRCYAQPFRDRCL